MRNTATHECLMDNCAIPISKLLAFCPRHWAMVPKDIQSEIYEANRDSNRNAWYDAIARARRAITAKEQADSPTVLITGRTFPVKDKLKELGGIWSPAENGWRVPKAQKMAAEVLVGNAEQEESFDFGDSEGGPGR